MKICEEKIPPLMVFQELFNENVLFARGINWLYPDKTEEQRLMGFANISSELLCATGSLQAGDISSPVNGRQSETLGGKRSANSSRRNLYLRDKRIRRKTASNPARQI